MSALSRMSMKARQRATQRYAAWRKQGLEQEITCAEAFRLTNLLWYGQRDPALKVRLSAVAIRAELGY